jgi:predicted Zn-dependent peptidase
VQIDKTAESASELLKEITAFTDGSRPATMEEIDKIQANNVRGMPGSYETGRVVTRELVNLVLLGRPDDYVAQLKQKTEAMPDEAVRAAAGHLSPSALTWVIVGDLKQIERPIRKLGLGDVVVLDADGNPQAGAGGGKGR